MNRPLSPGTPLPATPADDLDGAAQAAIERNCTALQERFPLPPEALGPIPAARPARAVRTLAVALLVAAGVLLVWQDPAWRTEQVATPADRRSAVELADGSRVELDTGTRLVVSRHLRSRRVVLEAGRALFDVQPSHWRPFTVDAGATQVRVLGTAFDVRRQHEEVTVTVLRGHVAVTGTDGMATTLTADDQVRAHAGRLDGTARVDSANATAWRQGQLVFQRTPLPEVLDEIARYSGRPVRLGDASLAQMEVSGVYRTANAEALLALLPSFLPVRVEAGPGGERVVQSRATRP